MIARRTTWTIALGYRHARRRERHEPESSCRRRPAWPGGGPGATPVVRPETQDLVGIVSAIDVPERIRDQLEAE
jgi:hypothetical protein